MRGRVHPPILVPTQEDSPTPNIAFLPLPPTPLSRNNPHPQWSVRPPRPGSPSPDRSFARVDSCHSRRSPHRRRQSVGSAHPPPLARCTQICCRPGTSSHVRLHPAVAGDLPAFHPTASVEPEFSPAVVVAAATLPVTASPVHVSPPARFVA